MSVKDYGITGRVSRLIKLYRTGQNFRNTFNSVMSSLTATDMSETLDLIKKVLMKVRRSDYDGPL